MLIPEELPEKSPNIYNSIVDQFISSHGKTVRVEVSSKDWRTTYLGIRYVLKKCGIKNVAVVSRGGKVYLRKEVDES